MLTTQALFDAAIKECNEPFKALLSAQHAALLAIEADYIIQDSNVAAVAAAALAAVDAAMDARVTLLEGYIAAGSTSTFDGADLVASDAAFVHGIYTGLI